MSVAFDLSRALVERAVSRARLRRLEGPDRTPHLVLTSPDRQGEAVGCVDVYAGTPGQAIDRVLHIWLSSKASRMDTNLVWVFAREDSLVPHYHAQAIHMPNDKYVYNVDLMPRLDLAVHEHHRRAVFDPLTELQAELVRHRQRAETRLPMPPLMGVFLSPWGIAGLGADEAELRAAWSVATAYLDQLLQQAENTHDEPVDAAVLRARHAALVAAHTSDEIDPRGWAGMRRAAGPLATEEIKRLMREPLAAHERA